MLLIKVYICISYQFDMNFVKVLVNDLLFAVMIEHLPLASKLHH